jgi:hypothetical protein
VKASMSVRVVITATVIRKDGSREELGTIVEKARGRARN